MILKYYLFLIVITLALHFESPICKLFWIIIANTTFLLLLLELLVAWSFFIKKEVIS
jgi:hypothetical protein